MKGAGLLNIVKTSMHWETISAPLAGWFFFAFSWLVGGQMSFVQAPNMTWNIIQAYVDKGKLNIVTLASLAQIILFVKKKCWDLFIYYYYFQKI